MAESVDESISLLRLLMMEKTRIGYIDAFRGLCLCWIIWIHTNHPIFLDYPLHLPALFFISGCFFKPYPWPVFWRKQVNRLVIPFVFFYLLYYVFLICLNYLKFHNVSQEIWSSVWDVFRPYSYNDGYIINYPLWFVMALIVLHFSTYGFMLLTKNRWLLLFIAVALSVVGAMYLRKPPLYFMTGRAMSYYIFYMFGVLFGKSILRWCEQNMKYAFIITVTLFVCAYVLSNKITVNIIRLIFDYIEVMSATIILAMFCQIISQLRVASVLRFVGENAMIILGLHDMYLTVCRIVTQSIAGEMNNIFGFLNVVFVLLLMWPSVLLLKKYLPHLVAEKPAISLP